MYAGGDGALLLLGVNHARSLYEAGLTKRDIQEKLWALARLPVEMYAADFVAMEQAAGRGDRERLRRTASPDDMVVVVAGGPGPQDVYIAAGLPQTRAIRL
jgi:hypothetical protein